MNSDTEPDPDDNQPRPLADAFRHSAGLTESFLARLAPATQRLSREITARFAPSAAAILKDIAPAIGLNIAIPIDDELREAVRRMHERFVPMSSELRQLAKDVMAGHAPGNWTGHDIDWQRAVDCTRDEGLPLAWVPNGATVHQLLELDDPDERLQLLHERRADVLNDCRQAATEVVAPSFDDIRRGVEAAISALHDGHDMAAQTLAATVVDTVVTEVFGLSFGPTTMLHAHRLKDETTLGQFRTAVVVTAAEHALTGFKPRRGQPIPVAFNRHATVHTLDPVQFNATNALVGVMLATSMAREAQELLNRGTLRVRVA